MDRFSTLLKSQMKEVMEQTKFKPKRGKSKDGKEKISIMDQIEKLERKKTRIFEKRRKSKSDLSGNKEIQML